MNMEMMAIVGPEEEGTQSRRTYLNYINEWEDLSILSLNQLRSIAKDLGIPSSSLRKESVIQALKAHHSMDWKTLKELLPDLIQLRKKVGSKSMNIKTKRLSKEVKKSFSDDVFKDLPLLTDINVSDILSDHLKRLSSAQAMPDLTGIKSVSLKKRLFPQSSSLTDQLLFDSSQKISSKLKPSSKWTPKAALHQQHHLGVIPDYYMPSKLHAYQCRRAETYVTYTSLHPILSTGGGLANEFQLFQT